MLEALIFLSGICIAVLSSNVAIIDNLPPPVNPSVIAKATYCSVAGIGYGSTHPIFITPRPRILLIWNAHVGDTWVGEITRRMWMINTKRAQEDMEGNVGEPGKAFGAGLGRDLGSMPEKQENRRKKIKGQAKQYRFSKANSNQK